MEMQMSQMLVVPIVHLPGLLTTWVEMLSSTPTPCAMDIPHLSENLQQLPVAFRPWWHRKCYGLSTLDLGAGDPYGQIILPMNTVELG